MADVAATLAGWSSTTASNAPAGSTSIGTGLDDNLREIQGVIVRGLSHKGSDIASVAGTMDIGAVEGLMHDITGALAITGLGTVRAGIHKWLKFEGAATLTHNATSLILPGAANITCADGDTALFISEGSGNWRCLSFQRAGFAPWTGTWQLINTYTPSAVASQAITGFDSTKYSDYKIVVERIAPANDNVGLSMRSSTNGGISYDATSGDYAHAGHYTIGSAGSAGTNTNITSTAELVLLAGNSVGNAANRNCSGEILILNPATAAHCQFLWHFVLVNSTGTFVMVNGGGIRLTAADVDAVQLLFGAGNIASGTIRFYGLRKA